MANPLYDRLNQPQQMPIQNNPMFNRFGGFANFMNLFNSYANSPQMMNPEGMVRNMLNSGQISQEQFNMANLAASQNAQTSRIIADNAAQTLALEQYLNPVPVPAYMVQNPNCCGNFYNGCGCN